MLGAPFVLLVSKPCGLLHSEVGVNLCEQRTRYFVLTAGLDTGPAVTDDEATRCVRVGNDVDGVVLALAAQVFQPVAKSSLGCRPHAEPVDWGQSNEPQSWQGFARCLS